MKQITIAGNCGKDAELRATNSGDKVLGFSVAVEERGKDGKQTVWFDVSLWGKRGEAIAQYVTKGSKIAVSGELTTREYEGKTYLGVKADQVTLMGGKRDDAAPSGAGSAPSAFDDDMDDSVPFVTSGGMF